MANAMYQKNGEFKNSLQGIRTVHNYAKKAHQGNPNDKKVKELYDQVRAKFEESQKKEEAPKQEAPKEEELTEGEKRGFKKVIITDPEEEKQKAEKKKQEESKKEEPKIKEEVKAPDAPRRANPAAA